MRGAPEHRRSDNGPEIVAQEIQAWLARTCVRTLCIQQASPWENGSVESFNGRLRDELVDRELFLSLPEARWWALTDYDVTVTTDRRTTAELVETVVAALRHAGLLTA